METKRQKARRPRMRRRRLLDHRTNIYITNVEYVVGLLSCVRRIQRLVLVGGGNWATTVHFTCWIKYFYLDRITCCNFLVALLFLFFSLYQLPATFWWIYILCNLSLYVQIGFYFVTHVDNVAFFSFFCIWFWLARSWVHPMIAFSLYECASRCTLVDFNFRWAESLIVFARSAVSLIWAQKLPISRSSDHVWSGLLFEWWIVRCGNLNFHGRKLEFVFKTTTEIVVKWAASETVMEMGIFTLKSDGMGTRNLFPQTSS